MKHQSRFNLKLLPTLIAAVAIAQPSFAEDAPTAAPLPPNRFPESTPVLKYSTQAKIPNAIPSIYSDRIAPVIKNWPRPELPKDPKDFDPIWMRAVHNPSDEIHIGIIKRMIVNAPMARLAQVIDQLADYYSIFPSLREIRVDRVDGNLVETSWEHRAPIFFLPNAAYRQTYIIDKSNPKRFIYRYQLVQGNFIEHTDGVCIIEPIDEARSMLSGYDFFMPALGPLKIFGSGKVWKDGTEGSFKGDISIKLRAEHPDWDKDRIKTESEAMLAKFPIDPLPTIEKGTFAPKPIPSPSPSPSPSPEPSSSPQT